MSDDVASPPRWLLSTDHKLYLQSGTWQLIRAPIIARAAGKCERCGKARNRLQVHHKTYVRTGGDELPSDLEALCGGCHRAHHGMTPTKPTPRYVRVKRPNRKARRKSRWKACRHCGGTYTWKHHRQTCEKFNLAGAAV